MSTIIKIDTIKNWFKTGKKPTEKQFSDTFDSFRHKEEKINISDVEGINELLQVKADLEAFNNHVNDEDKHGGGKLKEDFTPTVSFEGVTAGETLQEGLTAIDWLKKIFGRYVPSSITSLTVTYSKTTPLVGETITMSKIKVNSTTDSNGDRPKNVLLTIDGVADPVTIDLETTDEVSFDPVISFTVDNYGGETLVFSSAKDGEENNISSKSSSVTFSHQNMQGTSPTDIVTQAQADVLFASMSKTISNSKNRTISGNANTNDPNNYTLMAHASELGTITTLKLGGVEDVSSILVYLGEFDYNNGFITKKYKLYRLSAKGALGVGQSIVAS